MDFLEHEEQVVHIFHLSDCLTARRREILEAHKLQGNTYSEVAIELGISDSAVKKHVMHALKFFREKLNSNKKS